MTFNISNKDNYLWNVMITVLSANFAQVSATQTECWCKMNYTTHPKTKVCAKQNSIRWCQQCNKPGAIGRNRSWYAQRLWTETNYVMNTTTVSSCNLEQVTLTKYPNQNTSKRDNIKHTMSAASSKSMIIKSEWSDTKFYFQISWLWASS